MKKFEFLLAATLVFTVSPANAQQIGVVSSLEPSIEGTPPDQQTRVLAVGLDVNANERIVSPPDGRGQLPFSDQTSLTIAPNSELVLDKFVYDPDRDAGEIALTLGKGALRFIGGRITKKTDGIIRTSTATIGVRGGLVLVDLLDEGVRAIVIAAEYVCLEGRTGRHCASRSGAVLTEEGYQGVIGPEELDTLLRRLDGEIISVAGESRFSAGAPNVGPFDKVSISTTGEERDDVVIENLIREDLIDDRTIGRGSGSEVQRQPGSPISPSPVFPISPSPTRPPFNPNNT